MNLNLQNFQAQNVKKDLDWSNLGFGYKKCKFRFQAVYENGKWNNGEIVEDEFLHIEEGATSLHYSQQCFEGMKAFTAKDGRVLLFRPELNHQRMQNTANRLMMPDLPKELFLKGVCEAVIKNYDVIPPFGYGASLYIRPLLIGTGENLGIKKANKYIFRVFVVPVGTYYAEGKIKPLTLALVNEDRVAPIGIGSIKAGANYISSMSLQYKAKEIGADEIIYLDPLEHKYIEETGSANVLIYFKDKTLVTPKAETILPSITRRSAMQIAKDMLKLETFERKIDFYKEVENIQEFANCGTAAVISPVGSIIAGQKTFRFYDQGKTAGPIMSKLYTILTEIQQGVIEDTYRWTYEVK